MRVVSWNMAYWSHRDKHEDAWRWVLEELRPDVLLCQEAAPPDWVSKERTVVWSRAYPTGNQLWGTGIVTHLPCTPARIGAFDEWFTRVPSSMPGKDEKANIHRADGWLASARVTLPCMGDVLFSSVHNPAFPFEKERLADIDITRMKLNAESKLWFLDVLFFFLRPMLGSLFLVGGDFNYSRLLDRTPTGGNNEFFDRVRDEGFVSIHRLFHDADERTFFHEKRGHHQLDYLYADNPVAAYAKACAAHAVQRFSDHAPLIADFADVQRSEGPR